MVLTQWEIEDHLNASEADAEKLPAEAGRAFGGEPTVARFQQVLAQMPAGPPPLGSTLLVRPFKVDPAQLDETLATFKSVVHPEIKAQPGFVAVRPLVDRARGEGAVGIVWADNESANVGAVASEQRRVEAASRGVEFGEPMMRESPLPSPSSAVRCRRRGRSAAPPGATCASWTNGRSWSCRAAIAAPSRGRVLARVTARGR